MANFKKQLNKTLKKLITDRETWENGAYKKANTELYAILEKCGEIYDTLKTDKKSVRALNAILEDQGIKFTNGTSLALKIVRVVFGAQNNREHAYAKVIKVWFDEHDEGQTLTNFLIERGGVENVRREASNKSNPSLSPDDYREIAASELAGGDALTTFDVEEYMLSDDENDTDYMVALVRCDAAGTGNVLYGRNKRALVNAALAAIGKELANLEDQKDGKDELEEKKRKAAENMKQFLAKRQQKKAA